MKRKTLFLLAVLLVGVILIGPAISGDLANVRIPFDQNGQKIDTLTGVGVNYKVCTSTDPISIGTPPLLIYGTKVASDGSGTDWVKIISTYTTSAITDALTIDEVQSTTSQFDRYDDAPIFVPASATYCYIVVNNTNTYSNVHYLTK
jgi:hypothetical protein